MKQNGDLILVKIRSRNCNKFKPWNVSMCLSSVSLTLLEEEPKV